MDAFNVMPNDQHLKTAEGVHLSNNDATLADLAILPGTLILAKVSRKHCLINRNNYIFFKLNRHLSSIAYILFLIIKNRDFRFFLVIDFLGCTKRTTGGYI